MFLPSFIIDLESYGLSRISSQNGKVCGLIMSLENPTEQLVLNKVFILTSPDDLTNLGVTAESHQELYSEVSDFYKKAQPDTNLHLLLVSTDTTLESLCVGKEILFLKKVIYSTSRCLHLLGVNKNPLAHQGSLQVNQEETEMLIEAIKKLVVKKQPQEVPVSSKELSLTEEENKLVQQNVAEFNSDEKPVALNKSVIAANFPVGVNILWVNSGYTGSTQDGSIQNPYTSITIALANLVQDEPAEIRIAPGIYNEVILPTHRATLTLTAGNNDNTLPTQVQILALAVYDFGELVLQGISFSDVSYINSSNTITIENCVFASELRITSSPTITFRNCSLNEMYIAHGKATFENCFSPDQQNTLKNFSVAGGEIYLNNCRDLRLNHTAGIVISKDSWFCTPEDGRSVYSTATISDNNGLYLLGGGITPHNLTTGDTPVIGFIYKTGTCRFARTNFVSGLSDEEVLNGEEIEYGIKGDQVYINQTISGYTAADAKLTSHLRGIGSRFSTLNSNITSATNRINLLEPDFVTESYSTSTDASSFWLEAEDDSFGFNIYIARTTTRKVIYCEIYLLSISVGHVWARVQKDGVLLAEETETLSLAESNIWKEIVVSYTDSEYVKFDFQILRGESGEMYEGRVLVCNGRGSGYIRRID